MFHIRIPLSIGSDNIHPSKPHPHHSAFPKTTGALQRDRDQMNQTEWPRHDDVGVLVKLQERIHLQAEGTLKWTPLRDPPGELVGILHLKRSTNVTPEGDIAVTTILPYTSMSFTQPAFVRSVRPKGSPKNPPTKNCQIRPVIGRVKKGWAPFDVWPQSVRGWRGRYS